MFMTDALLTFPFLILDLRAPAMGETAPYYGPWHTASGKTAPKLEGIVFQLAL